MKRAISILGLVGILCCLFAVVDGRAWNIGNMLTSDAERDRAKAERLRDQAALLESQARARIQTAGMEADQDFRRFVLESAKQKDRLLEKYAIQAGIAQQKSSWLTMFSAFLGLVAVGMFILARRLSKRATMAEATVDEFQRRLSAAEHSGEISPGTVHKLLTGHRQLMKV